MIRQVTGDDIFIGGESFHPMYGSISKKEAQKKAKEERKRRYCHAGPGESFGAQKHIRVLYRERGIRCQVGGKDEKHLGKLHWVPFQGWVVYVQLE